MARARKAEPPTQYTPPDQAEQANPSKRTPSPWG